MVAGLEGAKGILLKHHGFSYPQRGVGVGKILHVPSLYNRENAIRESSDARFVARCLPTTFIENFIMNSAHLLYEDEYSRISDHVPS